MYYIDLLIHFITWHEKISFHNNTLGQTYWSAQMLKEMKLLDVKKLYPALSRPAGNERGS